MSAVRLISRFRLALALSAAFCLGAGNAEADDRAASSPKPIPAQFIGAADGFGVKQIKAENVPLLVDDAAGFYLIGSATGTDDRNNIASFVKNTGGVMHSMNGAAAVSLPYSFTVRADAKDPSKLSFKITLGPATVPLATVSMPLDGHRKLFNSYRYEGSNKTERYDQNPDHYTPPGRGQYNTRFAPGNPKWGEMIGPDYTVRVTLTSSSRPMSLAFVDAPSLSTGVRNVEFGFGRLAVGDRATATGYIQVFKSAPRLFQPSPVRQSEPTNAAKSTAEK